MLSREIDGLKLTFHLAGINNQNFLMRDEETGTYWQQINGAAVSGPLAGRVLKLIPSDELTFALWKAEQPRGTVLKDVASLRGSIFAQGLGRENEKGSHRAELRAAGACASATLC